MILSIDIGGTFTKYAYVERLEIVKKGAWATEYTLDKLFEKIEAIVTVNFEKIVISSGGFWDKQGKSLGYETIKATASGDFVKMLKQKYHCDVLINNDARCGLLGESECGVLKNIDNAVMLTLGSSIGCAVKINGKLFEGATGQAAEMFLMPEIVGDEVYCFNKLTNSILLGQEFCKLSGMRSANMIDIENACNNGDAQAKEMIEKYCKAVALKAWFSYLMYDPEVLVLSGGISNSDRIVERVSEEAKKLFQMDQSLRLPNIVRAKHTDCNLLGATLL